MNIGTTQSQATSRSLVASLSVNTQVSARKVATKQDSPAAAVLISVSRTVDLSYAQQVLQTELGLQLDAVLRDAGVEADLQGLLSGSTDLSPEATAKRIVDHATSFLGAFQANKPDKEGTEQVQAFSRLIREAVDQGFAQAKDVLKGMAELSKEVESDMDETYRLVMEGFADFEKEQLQVISASQPPVEEAGQDLLAV